MPLLDRQRPARELFHAGMGCGRVHLLQDGPVTDLARLGHRQELEAVESVGVLVEVDLEHGRALALGGARLLEDRGLLALEGAGELGAAPLRLGRFLAHLLERGDEVGALLLRERDHPSRGYLRGHREAGDLAELALEVRDFRHVAPSSWWECGLASALWPPGTNAARTPPATVVASR